MTRNEKTMNTEMNVNWYNESTFDNHFSSFEDFESNAKIKGLPVVEILKDIDDADVF